MTERENFLRTLRFDHPDHLMSGIPSHSLTYHGCNHEGYDGGGHDVPVGEHWTDIWGTIWYKEHPDVMGFPRGNPLVETTALSTYRWPDPDDSRICGKIYQLVEGYQSNDDQFLAGQHRDTLWEKAYMLVGMENMMEYFYTEPDFVREVLHRIMDFQLGIARHYLSLGVEVVFCGDDLGTQQAPLLNPQLVEEFFVPEYLRLFSLYKQHGVIIDFHSCGHIEPFLEMFIRLGIDVLNPVQATANNLARVRECTAGRLTLKGGVNTALIMQGPVAVIEQEVRRCMWELGRDGGYLCGPDQWMPFPSEHIDAVYRTISQDGLYPLQAPDTFF